MDFGLLYENDKGEYEVLNDFRMADIRLASLVYFSTYCVPKALLRQNKPFPLLYLGHAQLTRMIQYALYYSQDSSTKFFNFAWTVDSGQSDKRPSARLDMDP